MKSTGKNFEAEIRRSLKDKRTKCFWFRIQDTNDVSRFVKKAIAEKQPADFMAVYRSRAYLLECKTTRNLTSFPLYYGPTRSIPTHQVRAGDILERNGGIAYILIRRDESRNKTVFANTPSQANYLYSYYGKKRKSVPWEWFKENAIEVDRLAKPIRWNLRKLFDSKL